ncbi:MAG: FUSC family protein [Planctomycetaceae bacterium]|nr:FUSC family protein [Planctomycetaceae bacterium]
MHIKTYWKQFTAWSSRQIHVTPDGLRYVAKLSVGTALLWWSLRLLGDTNPVWAVIAFTLVAELVPAVTMMNVRELLTNTIVGGVVGLASLLVLGPGNWTLPVATSVAVLLCVCIDRLPSDWKLAPVTTAVILAESMLVHQERFGVHAALKRAAEVLIGGLLAVGLSYLLARLFPAISPESTIPAAEQDGARMRRRNSDSVVTGSISHMECE